jgi:hypothetical protein
MRVKGYIFFTALFLAVVMAAAGCETGVRGSRLYHDPVVPLDYSDAANWAYFYEEYDDNLNVDLFLIAPTVYTNSVHSMMPVDDDYRRQRFIRALSMQRGIYELECRIFAPFYRQAALSVYYSPGFLPDLVLEAAYADIRASFLFYMEHYNNGRPFIIAGFSQGADMGLRLLKEFFHDDGLSELLIAAYLIGWRITPDDIEQYPHLVMAAGELDTGVIISFNTEAPNVTWSVVVPETTLGINPLSWSASGGFAPRRLAKGSVFFDSRGQIISEIENLTGAYLCPLRGTLKLTGIMPADYPNTLDLFGEGVYHIYDYQFFFRDLQYNVSARILSYFKQLYVLSD